MSLIARFRTWLRRRRRKGSGRFDTDNDPVFKKLN